MANNIPPEIEKIFDQLTKLISLGEIQLADIEKMTKQFGYEPIKSYLFNMLVHGKPEMSTAYLMRDVLDSISNKKFNIATETKLESGGFADYKIYEKKTNPVQIELKPLFERKDEKIVLKNLNFQDHQVQIQKYMRDCEYLILTNLNQCFIFNRDAIIEYAPFYEDSLINLLMQYHDYESLWDTICRIDDKKIKPELESEFFSDLKNWYEAFTTVNFDIKNNLSKQELIVLFLNKVIFIKTLEDYGLIDYKFLENLYFNKYKLWITKGLKRVFDNFFEELEDWFFEYYDTELFVVRFWEHLKKDILTCDEDTEPNLEHFRIIFEKVLGFGLWELSFGKGMVHYNYRKIDEDVFGKAYETFIAENRKDSGIFYTPKSITQYMVTQTIKQLFEPAIARILDALKNENLELAMQHLTEMRKIKVIDTCSGSGSFLIKVLREIYSYYLNLEYETRWVREYNSNSDLFGNAPKILGDTLKLREIALIHHETDRRNLLISIILNHIYAIDIDERAIDTAKTNLWKEAVKLLPKLFNFKRLPKWANHILPNLQLNFINADTLFDLSVNEQIRIIESEFKSEIVQLHKIRTGYINAHNQPQLLEPVENIKRKIRARLEDEIFWFTITSETINNLEKLEFSENIVKKLKEIVNVEFEGKRNLFIDIEALTKSELSSSQKKTIFDNSLKTNKLTKPVFIALECFYAYFDTKGNALNQDQQGFSAIISNPPWEVIKPLKKEFATIGKYEMDNTDFEKWFTKQLKNQEFNLGWNKYKAFYDNYKNYLRNKFDYLGDGDLNYANIFIEQDNNLLIENGLQCLLIPSSFQTDDGTSTLRQFILIQNTLLELFSFENRGYKTIIDEKIKHVKLFPDVHPQFKFSITLAQKIKPIEKYEFNSLFYLHDPCEIETKSKIPYSIDLIKKFSPNSLSIMEFRDIRDYELCSKIRAEHQLFNETKFYFRRELHKTDDAHFFRRKKKSNNDFVLFEGKMIHQYNPNFNFVEYYVNKAEVYEMLLDREVYRIKSQSYLKSEKLKELFINQGFKLEFENYRLVYRAIAGSTNERTMICTIIPPNNFISHSMNFLVNLSYSFENERFEQKILDYSELCYIMGLFNSLTINYYLRNKVSANLTMNYIYELPFPQASENIKMKIIEKSFQLLYNNEVTGQFEELGNEIDVAPREIDKITERAELEVIVAKELFGLSLDDWKYLTSTFTFGQSESKKELDAIIEKSIQLFDN